MTQKTKKLKQFLTFTVLAGFLFGCQKEEFYEMETISLKVNEYTFNEANRMPMFNKAYHKVIKGINSINSISRSENVGFVIDSSTIKSVTVANATTYTMRIIRPTTTNAYFENLIINVTTQDSTKAFITKYTPTEVSQYVQEHESLSFQGTGEIKEVAFETNSTGSKIAITCVDVLVCDYEYLHLAGEKCGKTRMMRICVESQGGAGGEDGGSGIGGISIGYGGSSSSTGTGGNTGGSAGNGSNGGQNPPIVTAPVAPCTRCPVLQPPYEDPCATINKKINDNTFSSKALKDKTNTYTSPSVTSLNKETGFGIKKNSNGVITYPLLNNPPGNPNSVTVDGVGAHYSIHVHMDNYTNSNGDDVVTIKVPSPADFFGIAVDHFENALANGLQPQDAGGMIVTSQGVYAIEFNSNNQSAFNGIHTWNEMTVKFQKDCDDLVENNALTQHNIEKQLLIRMRKANIENKMSLLKVYGFNHNQNPLTSNLTFKKLVLNPSGTDFVEVPCNN